MKKQMLARIKNPFFLLAVAGLGYQLLEAVGVAVPSESYKSTVDVMTYLFIGTGVYSTFPHEEKEEQEEEKGE